MKYSVDIERRCVRDYHSGEKYGDWETEYDNTFKGITRSDKEYGDLESSLDIPDGTNVYVVWIEYSSGDSFGHGIRNDVDTFGVFTSREAASELARAIDNHNRKDHDYKPLKIKTSDGQQFDIYPSWLGYFERLDDVHVAEVVMGQKDGGKWWR